MKRREVLGIVSSLGTATAVSGCLGLGGSDSCGPGETEIQTIADNYDAFRGESVSLQGEAAGGGTLQCEGGCEVFEFDDETGTATVYTQDLPSEISGCIVIHGVVGPKDKIAVAHDGPGADIAVLEAVVIGIE